MNRQKRSSSQPTPLLSRLNIYCLTGLLFCVARLPHRAQLALGRAVGNLGYRFIPKRRAITQRNLALCFPELPESERDDLAKASFQALGMGACEAALGWWGSDKTIRRLVSFRGLEHLEAAKATGKGILAVGAHYSAIELSGRAASLVADVVTVYRKNKKNSAHENWLRKLRLQHLSDCIPEENLRDFIRVLKQGKFLWYMPDQDYGRKHSVFVPFFGVNAASIAATTKLARLGDAVVLPARFHRLSDNSGYELVFDPPLDNFPTPNVDADTQRINDYIEKAIRMHPEQYLWQHKRFKTRPQGEASLYG